MKKLFSMLVSPVVQWIGTVTWPVKKVITEAEKAIIKEKLKDNYYVILTRHNGHLSTYAINAAHWFMNGKRGYYAHALMNLEDEVKDDDDYRFIEATAIGVHYSGFDQAIDPECTSVALLAPSTMTIEKWTAALDKAKTCLGKPYDTLFDLADDNALSCVELVRTALRSTPDYDINFAHFEAMIKKVGNLDPQSFMRCKDFEVVFEIRH